MLILVGGEKGGCGKTTTATNLAVHLISKGIDVALLDADPKPAAYKWAKRRETNPDQPPKVPMTRVRGDILLTIEGLKAKHDVVIVDAGGMDSEEQRTALVFADLALFPFNPSQYDLDTVVDVNKMVAGAKALNRKLRTASVIIAAPTNPLDQDTEAAREYLASHQHLTPLVAMLYSRKAYKNTGKTGLGVVEMADPKAKAEIQSLAAEIGL